MYHTPILLIVFNRPELTKKTIKEILKQEPEYIYVYQDGPRSLIDEDKKKCTQVRQIIKECQSQSQTKFVLHYNENNLGCGLGPSSAITWFFEHVDKGIIFEDDCCPHPDFFRFCEELLGKYEDNEKVSFIGGCNYLAQDLKYSYHFASGHHQTWGWATWKRTWSRFDYSLKDMSSFDFYKIVRKYYPKWDHKEYWLDIFYQVKQNQRDYWDYQFYFSCWKNKMLAIAPNVNLVSNTGFGEDATHTSDKNDLLNRNIENMSFPLRHPSQIKYGLSIETKFMNQFIVPYYYLHNRFYLLLILLNKKLKRLLNHKGPWITKRI